MTNFEKNVATRPQKVGKMSHKPCYGLCERCVWMKNGGCSEWN